MTSFSSSDPDHPDIDAPQKASSGNQRIIRWICLLGLSVIFVAFLEYLNLPAARLLGPMVAGIVIALTGEVPRLTHRSFYAAQAIIGCLIASGLPLTVVSEIGHHWPIFIIGIVFVVLAATALGWLQMRFGSLPGTTALWGTSPGAASAVLLMAEEYGADVRLVALMQYVRAAGVAFTASLVAHFAADNAAHELAVAPNLWFPAFSWISLLETLAVAFAGLTVAVRLRIPAGPVLVPMIMATILSNASLMTITLPPWLLTLAYALIGWNIGLRFTRSIIVQAARALPAVFLSAVALIVACGLFAILLAFVTGIDPMTAYLATSPGGADSMAIIAASTHVDMAFVMSMQTCRLVAVIVFSPLLMRVIANRNRPQSMTAER